MRRSRRGGGSGMEFGGSGEDSFVAVVVTKLTGALLFILLLTMVIMALLPKVMDTPPSRDGATKPPMLAIATPETLPEAIAGHPYTLALAATGGSGPLKWAVDGKLPEGLSYDAATGLIQGTPRAGTPRPAELVLRVVDGSSRAVRPTQLVVFESDTPLTTPSRWKPSLPPIPWKAWMEQGFGFLVLLMVHLVGLNIIGGLERIATKEDESPQTRTRFLAYRVALWLATTAAAAGLAVWLWKAGAS